MLTIWETVLNMMRLFKRTVFCLALLLALLLFASASADVKVTFEPQAPKMGEYVDVTVEPEREGAVAVRYDLRTADGPVFKGEDDTHFTASFRPREEA